MFRSYLLAGVFLCASGALGTDALAQGYVREPDEAYRSFVQQPVYRAFLPPNVDLSARFPVPGDQGTQGSCTAWAVGYALRSYHEGVRRDWDMTDSTHQVSPAWIYNRLTEDRRCSNGTAISDALKLLKSNGAVDLASFPYSATNCSVVDAPQQSSTSQWRISDWRSVNMARLDNIKGEIAKGSPVVFGMDMSKSLEELRGDAIYDDLDSPRIGGHAMVAVGYDDGRQAFKVMNSWGTRWGSGGFGWISYRAMTTLSDRGFIMTMPGKIPPIQQSVPVAPIVPPLPKPVVVADIPLEPLPAPPPVQTTEPAIDPNNPPLFVTPQVRVKPNDVPVAVVPPEPVVPAVNPPAVKPPVVKPVPAPKPLTPAEMRARVSTQLASMECANVQVSPAKGDVAALNGFVGSIEDRNTLAQIFGANGPRVAAGLKIFPWPQCEALQTFAGALSTPRGLDVRVVNADPMAVTEGSNLVVEVTTPNHPTYLYVTYLQAGGSAVHLYQPTGLVPKALPPNQKITLGNTSGGPIYRIGAPYGGEMIVAIASASPLFTAQRPANEIERDYLTAFRLSFLEKPKPGMAARTVSAATTTLTTRARAK